VSSAPIDPDPIVAALRERGARFAFLHGSRAAGTARPGSDVDVAAYWGCEPPGSWEVGLPSGVDLLVLDTAPLELRGRVAVGGRLLFEDSPEERVAWQAQTRKIYFDEEPRQRRLDREFLEERRRGR